MKLLISILLTITSLTTFADTWDDLNTNSAGTYTITSKGNFFGYSIKEFTLTAIANRIARSNGPNEVAGQMGELEFTSKEFGICKGSYNLSFDDETFSFNANVIGSINGIHCSKLVNSKYKWITVWLIYPAGIQLNSGSTVQGELVIRYEGREVFYEKVNITPTHK